jgi:hypothetical protein
MKNKIFTQKTLKFSPKLKNFTKIKKKLMALLEQKDDN